VSERKVRECFELFDTSFARSCNKSTDVDLFYFVAAIFSTAVKLSDYRQEDKLWVVEFKHKVGPCRDIPMFFMFLS